jgi:hypothetical protein
VFSWIAVTAGCGSTSPSSGVGENPTSQFVPSVSQAEGALRDVFESWKKDVPPGIIPGTSPAVHVTDTYRKPGEKLVDYRILGEVPSERKRCIAVELRYEPERAERVRFLVVGIDPLWVFREEDGQNLAHWEHNMEVPNAAKETRSGKTDTESSTSKPEPASAVKPDSEASP